MWGKRLSIIVCAVLFLLFSVNKATSSSAPQAGPTPGVTPSTFGAFSDARQIANGCTAIAFSRSSYVS